jgi:hypothetical protein
VTLTEQERRDAQPAIYLFGFREPNVMRIDPTPLGRWMMGEDVPIDAELAAAIREEFNAQERYRVTVMRAVQATCGRLLQTACGTVAPIEHPVTTTHEAFWRGYALGKYEAFSSAAAELSEIPIIAALAMDPANDNNTQEQAPDGAAVGQP